MPTAQSRTADGTGVRVRVQTFGRFAVEVDGTALRFEARGQRKPLELLKALIACGAVHVPQDRLAEALWPESEGDAAQGSFAATLHRLRQLIGSDALSLRGRMLSLDSARCWVDAQAFADEAKRLSDRTREGDLEAVGKAIERALAIYRGPFLEGEFEPTEIPSARARLHATFLRLVREGAEFWRARGVPESAIALYWRGLEADEVAEEFHQGLMRCHLAAGSVAEGIAAYRRCRDVLSTTVNVRPSAETERIHQELLAAQAAAPRSAETDSSRVFVAAGPLPVAETGFARRRLAVIGGAMLVLAALVSGGWQGYRGWSDARAVEELKRTAAFPLPDTPSIAVLAFANLSGDPNQEYFSDGISDSIITRLARIHDLLVIARTSTFTYKGKSVDIRQIGREMGVRHVLEGSVSRSGNRLRVTAQLIDAATGRHVWADSYDRDAKDVLAVMDDITRMVANRIRGTLVMGETAEQYTADGTSNPEANDKWWLAFQLHNRFSRENMPRIKQLFSEAIELDPRFAGAIGFLAWMHFNEYQFNWSADPLASLREAETLARRALDINPNSPTALSLMSRMANFRGDFDESVAIAQRMLQIAPGIADLHSDYALTLVRAGDYQGAISAAQLSLRLSPFPTPRMLLHAGHPYYLLRRFEEARPYYEKVIERSGQSILAYVARINLIDIHMHAGRDNEARNIAAQLLEQIPKFSVSRYRQMMAAVPMRDKSSVDPTVHSLRRAGIPE